MNSLDPRVSRLPHIGEEGKIVPKTSLDQFGTYEVFVQPKEGKPFQHEGIVHAPNLELAYILAKETFTRRFTCTSLYVTDTRDVFASPITEGDENAYDQIKFSVATSGAKKQFEIYHLLKRGKQHVHAGNVEASSPEDAMSEAKQKLNQGKIVFNIWAIETNNIRFTSLEEQELWLTLPDKKFRDAANYKGGEKLSDLLEKGNFIKK
ncbi:MAG: phenylacetic acid degradation b [Cyclobacteriaceae bacterium]|nr:phenylacetic acid degradation b [Cyclobacteriaceae bacterium]